MRRFQSIFLAVWLIQPTLLLVSCKKDLPFIDSEDTQSATFSDNGFVQYAWTDDEARFFSLAPPAPLSGGSIVTFRTEDKVYHPIIVDAYKKIAEQNEAHDFVEDLQNMVGTPYWEKAFVYHNRETGQEIALIPLFASDADKISGVISVKREGSDLIISGISRDNLLRSEEGDPSVRLAYADWVLKYQSWMLGTESDTELKEALCGYVERETDTQQTPPPPPDCSWVLVEMCSDDDSQTVWIGGRENIPLHLDHDRDGVINSEDQDWLELIRDTDITQEYWERFVFDWWEDHNQDQDYWDYWDNDDYFNDQYDDFWDDWQDPQEHEGRGLDWGDIWGDIVDFFDGHNPFEWQDGRGHDRGPGDDCDPFDPFNGGGGREIRCDVVYLLYCGQSGAWWTSADIIPCPSCGPQDSDAAEQYFADKLEKYINTYDLQDHRSLLNSLIDVADCPVSAPDDVVFECFTGKLAAYFEEEHPDVTLTAAEQAWLIELPDVLGAIIELSQTTGQGQYSEAQIDNFIEVATNLDLDSETAGWLLERSNVTAEVGDFLDNHSNSPHINTAKVAALSYLDLLMDNESFFEEINQDFQSGQIDDGMWDILKELLIEGIKEMLIEQLADLIPGGAIITMGPQVYDAFSQGDYMGGIFLSINLVLDEADTFIPLAKVASVGVAGGALYKKVTRVYKNFKKLQAGGQEVVTKVYQTLRQHLGVTDILKKWKFDGGQQSILEGVNPNSFWNDFKDRFSPPYTFIFNGNPVLKLYQIPLNPSGAWLYASAYTDSSTVDPLTGNSYPLTVKFYRGPNTNPPSGTNPNTSPLFNTLFIIRLR